ncbi:predicted protein [Plenodomus lingam JN3]|uniref:Predicted protein n=1 Tax=Leptosphaeria maculans (strain JN3 / isolate v23.1.3 / race Av1-4-5-6-7-8) TaxID=985895 RepID=E5ABT1_LEPMJ|nr:predicted protein [Plenodomus lingam JN3]CBY01122.1 predicted protein [Plenodomus lingam JN3]
MMDRYPHEQKDYSSADHILHSDNQKTVTTCQPHLTFSCSFPQMSTTAQQQNTWRCLWSQLSFACPHPPTMPSGCAVPLQMVRNPTDQSATPNRPGRSPLSDSIPANHDARSCALLPEIINHETRSPFSNFLDLMPPPPFAHHHDHELCG